MKNAIITGCGGRMGKAVAEKCTGSGKFRVIFGIDPFSSEAPFPVYDSFEKATEKGDVIIDFSNHSAVSSILGYAVKNGVPVLIATTGHTDEEKKMIYEASKKIPVFFSSNMSLGVAVLNSLVKETVKRFPDADVEIVEAHHRRKLDAPSGTCLTLAETVKEVRSDAQFVFGRHGMSERKKNDVGIHSIRMGNEVGTHTVIISTDNETITLEHKAHSRDVFADGAVEAAAFLIGKKAGLYTMKDLLGENDR